MLDLSLLLRPLEFGLSTLMKMFPPVPLINFWVEAMESLDYDWLYIA